MVVGKPAYWDEACAALSTADPVLARLIATYPQISLEGRGDPFQTLARSIVGQQISVKAADSVWRKTIALLGAMESPLVLARSLDELRSCGLSLRKAEYLQDLARHHAAGRLNPADWADWDDEAVIKELTSIRGIGRWTAEMFLMFHLLRPNILPLDDIGLINAIALNYHEGERLGKAECRKLAERWQPWCTVATWYFWRSLEPVPVSY
ncbi:DNA-3-methyladenine glycosylase II [Andreprevotia lacus DSM 23236]|jgi:DNA-3-methyladenine glycosylase II|uniref:DNA-3-methyladenine glycosylase II n=1 Tax=Andreprevotia lacus DSM 23236 TaxID=1121001 RepID=A0A1W1XN76_9NEIS|nr:DNA-3-methyladenine glycosylase [Andreprevotia lacus]SMC25307.1 DNA-3-methyladenine glycosylase II [Andreprevotia lacus DSM 23236]